MNPAATTISIIIPTHNRSQSTRRLLDKLALQTYPLHLMEVVAVANGCTDDTVAMLSGYTAPYAFKFTETNGPGPAVPRNKGASIAAGDILIFLDDDVDPSTSLAEAHVLAHEDENSVVIGYLPLAEAGKKNYYRSNLKMWWENKFQQMRKPGYRFSYDDLLSGNFSVAAKLYHKVNGFITDLRCRDDYELGMRLLAAGANFKFSKNAWGLHCDTVTDLHRSLKRKREEGKTDVRLSRIHPEITNELQNDYRNKELTFPHSRIDLMIKAPWLTDRYAAFLSMLLPVMEKMGLRGTWQRIMHRLHAYWYYKGLLDELKTKENLLKYLFTQPAADNNIADADLAKGIEAVEKMIDQQRPHSLNLYYGNEKIGTVPHQPGAEPLKGAHLRKLLAKKFADPLLKSWNFQEAFNTSNKKQTGLPAISVVVCTRNRTAQLSNCLFHLLAMQYENFEIIVVDNAPSTDDTKQLVASLPVRYVREERPGLDWARNCGIANAKHNIIAFTDDDVRVPQDWLQCIGNIFLDEEVMGASGYVEAAELETPAQQLFENAYGGMGHGLQKKYFHKDRISKKQLLWASSFGIGANMAFRKEVFNSIGGFDTAFDVGTPTNGCGDVEMFHRLVAKGHLFVYDPSMMVWHHHRKEIKALKKQIYDNGRGFGCYLIDCYKKRTVERKTIIGFWLNDWLYEWNIKNLLRRKKKIPAAYTIMELRGMLSSPLAYSKSKKRDKKLRLQSL